MCERARSMSVRSMPIPARSFSPPMLTRAPVRKYGWRVPSLATTSASRVVAPSSNTWAMALSGRAWSRASKNAWGVMLLFSRSPYPNHSEKLRFHLR